MAAPSVPSFSHRKHRHTSCLECSFFYISHVLRMAMVECCGTLCPLFRRCFEPKQLGCEGRFVPDWHHSHCNCLRFGFGKNRLSVGPHNKGHWNCNSLATIWLRSALCIPDLADVPCPPLICEYMLSACGAHDMLSAMPNIICVVSLWIVAWFLVVYNV